MKAVKVALYARYLNFDDRCVNSNSKHSRAACRVGHGRTLGAMRLRYCRFVRHPSPARERTPAGRVPFVVVVFRP